MSSRAAVRKQAGPSRHTKAARRPLPDGDARPAPRLERAPLAEPFHVAVDRQLKAGYATHQQAAEAALAIKRRHPRLDVTVYDAKGDRHTAVALPTP